MEELGHLAKISDVSIALLGTEMRSSGSTHFYRFLCGCFRKGLEMSSLFL